MKELDLTERLVREQVLSARALTTLLIRQLPDAVRVRVLGVVTRGSGFTELRTNVESGEIELLLVPVDGSEPLWLTPAHPP